MTDTTTRKPRRIFRWVFLAVQVIFVIWIIAGLVGTHHGTDCGTLDANTCEAATDVGASIAVYLIVMFWAAVDVILGLGYVVFRLSRREGS